MSQTAPRPRLFLLPTPISDIEPSLDIPPSSLEAVAHVRDFVVENQKSAWRFLSQVFPRPSLSEMQLLVLNEHSSQGDIPELCQALVKGRDMALISEAGCPGIADPGQDFVRAAHGLGARVIPLVGPSSILLALMASGMNGQGFCFHGYLPRDRAQRRKTLRQLERQASQSGHSQVFIEAPYRNDGILSDLSSGLKPDTLVCVASDMRSASESIISCPASQLASRLPSLGKKPAIFIIGTPHAPS